MADLEIEIEDAFVRYARSLGVLAVKFKIESNRDFPDRLVLASAGNAFFIEFKLPGETPRKGQLWAHRLLRKLGFNVYVIDNIAEAKRILHEELTPAPKIRQPQPETRTKPRRRN